MTNATTPIPGSICATSSNEKWVCKDYDTSINPKNYGFNDAVVFFRKNSDSGIGGVGQEMLLPQRCLDQDLGYYYYLDTSFSSTPFLLLTIAILAILMCINCKTWHPYKLDFYKSINYYILGTLAFGVALQVSGGIGFTRPIAVGVLLHNTAEFFILKKLWFGNYGIGSYVLLTGAIYQIFFLSSILWMPLLYLYLFAMFQGASMDFALVISYGVVAHLWNSESHEWNCKAWTAGCIAAIIHISSIIPMFFGMELGRSTLTFSATAGLALTFLIYELYLACRYGRIICCNPSYSLDVKLSLNLASSETMSNKLHLLAALDNLGSTGGGLNSELNQLGHKYSEAKENIENNNNNEPKDNDNNDNNEVELKVVNDSNKQASINDAVNDLINETQVGLQNNLFDDINAKDITRENHLNEKGILIMFCKAKPKQDMCECKVTYCFWITTVLGACTSLGFSLWVWFSPALYTGRCRS